MKSFAAFRRAAARLPGERYAVDFPVDARGQYQLELTGDFPSLRGGGAVAGTIRAAPGENKPAAEAVRAHRARLRGAYFTTGCGDPGPG